MPIVRYGPLVQAVSGSLGSVTFKGGASTGTITQRRRHPPPDSPAQQRSKILYAHHARLWRGLPPASTLQWETAAHALLWPNRLSTRAPVSGHALFMWFAAVTDPTGSFTGVSNETPWSGTTRAPVITAASFTAPATASITVDPGPGGDWLWYLTLTRHLALGPRNSAGRIDRLPWLQSSLATTDFSAHLAANGITLLTGEELSLTLRFWNRAGLPSDTALLTVTVS